MRNLSLIAILLPLALFVLSCSQSEPYNPQGWQELSSPFYTLWDVCWSFHHVDETDIVKRFSTLLGDDFLFYFDSDDIGDSVSGYVIPAFWTKVEFITAVNNMFRHAYDLHLDIPILEQGEDAFGKPAEGDTSFNKPNVAVSFVVIVSPIDGYQAQGYCSFEFKKNGDNQWQISAWRDDTASPGALSGITFRSLGYCLAFYAQP